MRSTALLILLLSSIFSYAQVTELSPYSRFGIGDPERGEFMTQFAMGGTGIAVVDGIHINPLNPASHSFLRSPAFEFGLMSERLEVSSTEESSLNSTSRFNHFAIGFPMWKGKWGAAFGLKPYTTVGYENTVNTFDSAIDTTYTTEYIGSGGANTIFLAISRKLTLYEDTSKYSQDNLISIGAQMDYIFGSGSSERNTVFPINSGFISTRVEDATTANDIRWLNTGMMMRFFLDRKEDEKDRFSSALNIGAQYALDWTLDSRRSRNAFTYIENLSGVEFPRDSVTTFTDRRGEITIPGNLAFGLSYESYILNESRDRQRKLTVALDYKLSDWTALRENFGQEVRYSEMGEYSSASIGISYSPQVGVLKGTRGNIFQMSTYMLGYRRGNSHLMIDNQEIEESGISFGMSIPLLERGLKTSDTHIDLSVAYEERGTTDNGLLQEQGLRVMLGFSFHPKRFDRWFAKRKYD